MDTRVKELVTAIYPNEGECADRVMAVIERHRRAVEEHRERFGGNPDGFPLGPEDAILISYGDSFTGGDRPGLQNLFTFLDEVCEGAITGVHILPFSPWSSDDGFSVIDYRQIDPALGSWEDVEAIAEEFRLMADLVLNHCSAQSDWFARWKAGEPPWDTYFIDADPAADYSSVVRPRALPLLTPVETTAGQRHVWTTFSADQVDLNWKSPAVLEEMLDVFLGYLGRGAQLVRLDAIAYLWKELGTSCLHLENTHRVVKLFRRAMELVDPGAILITETNVPHPENVSYFGDGDEAHMVYNFSLPPLLLDAISRGDATHLQRWAGTLEAPGEGMSFFNFCASHDGVGLTPTHGILSDDERAALIDHVLRRGGRISYKATPAGEIPYEMNINYLSACADAALPDRQRARAFLVTQAVMLSFAGVPGIYVHSLIGSENWQAGVDQTGMNRTINREKVDLDGVRRELATEGTLRNRVFTAYRDMLAARADHFAFHPRSPQRVLASDPRLFVLLRGPYEGQVADDDESMAPPTGHVLCVHNLSDAEVEYRERRDAFPWPANGMLRELVSGDLVYPADEGDRFSLVLEPHEVAWLAFGDE